jgi:outer membrane protein assembly factor BamB
MPWLRRKRTLLTRAALIVTSALLMALPLSQGSRSLIASAPQHVGTSMFSSQGEPGHGGGTGTGGSGSVTGTAPSGLPPPIGAWPTYEYSSNRSGTNVLEDTLAPDNASNLQLLWNITLPGPVVASPSEADGTVFVGSWDGYEYALNASDGAILWKTFLGQETFYRTSYGAPWLSPLGVSSSATISDGTVYVGAFHNVYALDSASGAILWNESIFNLSAGQDPVADGYYTWSGPTVYNGHVYIGISSQIDNPLVVGGIDMFDASTGAWQAQWLTEGGLIGGSVWSTPTVDALNNTIWVTTGNGASQQGEYGQSMVALSAANLAFEGAWEAPISADNDFGAGDTLFGAQHWPHFVGATNKNGFAYALNGTRASSGPVWSDQLTKFPGASGCQPPGQAIAPGAWDGSILYMGSSYTTIGGVDYNGSVRAIYPNNGSFEWQTAAPGTVQAGLASSNGVVVDTSRWYYTTGPDPVSGCYTYHNTNDSCLQVLASQSGQELFRYFFGYPVVSAPTIADGRIFVGATINSTTYWNTAPNHSGHVYAFGIPISAWDSHFRPYDLSTVGGDVYGFGNATGGMPSYSYTWSWGDGNPSGYGRYASHTYYASGKFTATLSIVDAGAEIGQAGWQVYNQVYTCGTGFGFCWITSVVTCLNPSCTYPIIPGVALFAAYVYGAIGATQWTWNFGDGSGIQPLQYPSHTYTSAGTYTVVVTATDSNNDFAMAQFSVTV